jgi:hypothetical protein
VSCTLRGAGLPSPEGLKNLVPCCFTSFRRKPESSSAPSGISADYKCPGPRFSPGRRIEGNFFTPSPLRGGGLRRELSRTVGASWSLNRTDVSATFCKYGVWIKLGFDNSGWVKYRGGRVGRQAGKRPQKNCGFPIENFGIENLQSDIKNWPREDRSRCQVHWTYSSNPRA